LWAGLVAMPYGERIIIVPEAGIHPALKGGFFNIPEGLPYNYLECFGDFFSKNSFTNSFFRFIIL
jgi:hypothetical protein